MHLDYNEPLLSMMNRLVNLHRKHVHHLLRKQDIDVYPGQPPLLEALSKHNGQSQQELADKLCIKPATLSVMLQRMEKSGLIQRSSDNKDQRISRVYLTEAGQLAHREVEKALEQIEYHCFSGFTPEEKQILHKLLLRVYHHLHDQHHCNADERSE